MAEVKLEDLRKLELDIVKIINLLHMYGFPIEPNPLIEQIEELLAIMKKAETDPVNAIRELQEFHDKRNCGQAAIIPRP